MHHEAVIHVPSFLVGLCVLSANRRHSVIRSNMAGNVAEVLEPQWIYSLIHFRGCEKVHALFDYTNRNRVV